MKPFLRHAIAVPCLALGLAAAAPSAAQPPKCPYLPCSCPGDRRNTCPQSEIPVAGPPPVCPPSPDICHPYPQPIPLPSVYKETPDCPAKDCTGVITGEGIFPPMNPFNYQTFPGNNFLPTVYTNVFDSSGKEIPNTLPSTPNVPYNLHDGDPVVSTINPTSPEDDLSAIFHQVLRLLAPAATKEKTEQRLDPEAQGFDHDAVLAALQLALDIIEGEPVPGRVYSGFPLLHYIGLEKVGKVLPFQDQQGKTSYNVDVHQVWYNQRIESDTSYIDLSALPPDATWTITYTVDALNRGRDDFSPFVMYLDPAIGGGIGMDQSFFDMEDGTRTVFKIKMAPASYYSLVYTWGWRMHPPRAQVMENAAKKIDYMGAVPAACPADYQGKKLPQLEQAVFCPQGKSDCAFVGCGPGEPRYYGGGQPMPCERQKIDTISKTIGDLAPEKRMWNAVREAQRQAFQGTAEGWEAVSDLIENEALPAYTEWLNRNQLPKQVKTWVAANVKDYDKSDVILFYVNNSTYGELTNGAWGRWDSWEERPKKLKVLVLNGDYFVHSYTIADFGGNRGWENQFRSSVKLAGSGCWFTFGRNWIWLPVGGAGSPSGGSPNPFICVEASVRKDVMPPIPSIGDVTPAVHWINVDLNYDPSRRLRFYQFDPFHHDVAIYSVH